MQTLLKEQPKSIYTPQFFLACTSLFLFFASFNMIIPELPAYLSSLGGEDYKGLIIALFTLSACLSRPFSGKLADTIGRKPVIFFGILMSFLCGLFYPILNTIIGFLLLRFLHGFSTGFTPTGISAFVADIIPADKRGEAMGAMGLAGNIGTAFGPAMGSEIAQQVSINALFYTASGFACLSMLILLGMKETLSDKQKFGLVHLKINRHEIIDWQVIAPAIVMVLTAYSYGTLLTVVPDMSTHLGLKNKGMFFTFYTLSSLGIRILAGKLSDKFGRRFVLKWGCAWFVVALTYLGFADTGTELLVGACLFGVAMGIASPTVFAWTIDLGNKNYMGRGIATVYIALELGIGLGALTTGWVYANNTANFGLTYWIAAFASFLALIYLFKK